MKKSNKWLYLIILVCITTFIVTKSLQNDTFYSIKIGKYILEHGMDMKDHFSGISGLSYTYPHWLFDVIVGLSYQHFGINSLYILTIILSCILTLSIFKLLNKLFKEELLSFFVTFIVALFLAPFLALRAQLTSYICFVWFVYNLLMFLKDKKRKNAISMLIISIFIANTHAAIWPFVLVLFLPYFVEYLCYILNKKVNLPKWLTKMIVIEKEKNIKYLSILFIIIAISGLITPLNFTPYTYTIKTFLGTSTSLINEHYQSALNSPFFTFLLIIPLIIFIIFGKKKKLSDVFMLIGLILLAVMSRRHIALLLVIGVFYIFKYLLNKVFKYQEILNWIKEISLLPISRIIIFIIFTIPYILLFKHNLSTPIIDEKEYPIKSTTFLKENFDINTIKVFNDYNYGAYLLFQDVKPHIDSRCDLYTYPFNKKMDYFNKYIDFDKTFYKDYWNYFKSYGINTIILKHNSYLLLYLYKDYRFHPVYLDENFVIFQLVNYNK